MGRCDDLGVGGGTSSGSGGSLVSQWQFVADDDEIKGTGGEEERDVRGEEKGRTGRLAGDLLPTHGSHPSRGERGEEEEALVHSTADTTLTYARGRQRPTGSGWRRSSGCLAPGQSPDRVPLVGFKKLLGGQFLKVATHSLHTRPLASSLETHPADSTAKG